MSKVTIRDVAREAGVSVSSVSRILRGGQGHVYPKETHDRVRGTANRLGYQPNPAARLLRQTTRTLIGMVVHHTEHPHLNRCLVTMRSGLIRSGYDPVIFDSVQLSEGEAGQSFPPPDMLAGLINLSVDLDLEWPEVYQNIHRAIPIVATQAISRQAAAHIDVIHVDYSDAYLQGIVHLQQLGHKHIAYLGPEKPIAPIDLYKFKGWKAAAKQAGINPEFYIPWHVKQAKKYQDAPVDALMSQTKIQEAVIEAATDMMRLTPRPTAIMCTSDEVAICLQSYLLAKGWNLPGDLSIVGYDGISFGALVFPALTTLEPDQDAIANVALARLQELIEERANGIHSTPREMLTKPHLIVRASTAPPSQG